jgi:ribosomal protein S18 acetylase RimI-like enzyme
MGSRFFLDASRVTKMRIKEMRYCDLDAVVAVHMKVFDGFFLTRMGPSFLRAYYKAVLDFESSIALVAHEKESDCVLGFAVGFSEPQRFYALFGERRNRMLPTILLAVLRDPGLAQQIIRNMRRVNTRAQQPVDAVELSSIAVGVPGRGVGGALLDAFADKARSEGSPRITLTTDAKGNDYVRGFYEARGFSLEGTETREARELSCYSRELS